MIDRSDQNFTGYADIIAENIGSFVEDLRAVDLVDLISFIRFESFPTVEDLVNSSTELFFKAETLMFAWAAGVDLNWEAPPVVTLGLEFRHPGVSVFFDLTLRDVDHTVVVLGAVFDDAPDDPCATLAAAFAAARVPGSFAPPVPALGTGGRRAGSKGLPWP